MSGKGNKAEKVSQKSAAEFFSEHQQIAGFDNPGKSLYTTIRELVENSLDAAESIQQLPDIKVTVVRRVSYPNANLAVSPTLMLTSL
jgi:DNA topoisomerase VI subunit B